MESLNQLIYVQNAKASVDRPIKELKGFYKVNLKPGEEKVVTMKLNRSDFAFWDENTHAWKIEGGKFAILVGSSSKNTMLSGRYTLK